jgi:hypothetical protein
MTISLYRTWLASASCLLMVSGLAAQDGPPPKTLIKQWDGPPPKTLIENLIVNERQLEQMKEIQERDERFTKQQYWQKRGLWGDEIKETKSWVINHWYLFVLAALLYALISGGLDVFWSSLPRAPIPDRPDFEHLERWLSNRGKARRATGD